MWRSAWALLVAPLAAGLALGLAAGGPAAAPPDPLPPDEHMPLVLGACIICHSPEMVAQQRLDRATWEAIVDRMISYGAPITPATRPLILDYLARRLGP
jgi:mono/diheme cytochrome c family protein